MLLIARAENARYREHRDKLLRPVLRRLRAGEIDSAEMEDVTIRVFARTVLLGWKNLQDDDGQEIPYSEVKALELMRSHRDFFLMVQELALDAEMFRARDAEESRKNS